MDSFLQAIQLNPHEVIAYINLGNLYDEQGKKEDAEKEYRKAITLDPKNGRAHFNLGVLFLEESKKSEAKKELTLAMQVNPNDSNTIKQCRQLLKENIK
jgi:Flp pilus assembly protein TadD